MKRVLIIFLVLFLAVAVWFRWLDELDPETVKGEIQTQTTLLKEKSKTFSLKDEIANIIAVLDRFFSAPPKEMVVIIPSNDSSEMLVVTQNPDNVVENYSLDPSAEYTIVDSEILENPPAVDLSVLDSSLGYPAPMADPVETLAPAETAAIADVNQQPVDIADVNVGTAAVQEPPVDEVSSDTQSFEFNQLQETVPGSFLPYNLQSVDPFYTTNFVHPESGCDWLGVAGQIFSENMEPKDGLIVVVEGAVNNSMVEVLGFSGLAQSYGPGGYELVLSNTNKPGIFWIQLFDVNGSPLSGIYSFQTNGTCEQNLAIINFTLNSGPESKYVPTVTP